MLRVKDYGRFLRFLSMSLVFCGTSLIFAGASWGSEALSEADPHPCYEEVRREVRRHGHPSNPYPHRFAPDLVLSDLEEHQGPEFAVTPWLLWFSGSYHSGYFAMYAVVDPQSCKVLDYILLEAE